MHCCKGHSWKKICSKVSSPFFSASCWSQGQCFALRTPCWNVCFSTTSVAASNLGVRRGVLGAWSSRRSCCVQNVSMDIMDVIYDICDTLSVDICWYLGYINTWLEASANFVLLRAIWVVKETRSLQMGQSSIESVHSSRETQKLWDAKTWSPPQSTHPNNLDFWLAQAPRWVSYSGIWTCISLNQLTSRCTGPTDVKTM